MELDAHIEQVKNIFYSFILFLQKDAFRGAFSYQTNKTGLLVLISVFFILIFYKPFDIGQTNHMVQCILIIGCAVCSFIGYSITITIFSPYNKKKWTNFQEIYTYFTCFLLTSILIYGYTIFCYNFLFSIILNIKSLNVESLNLQTQQHFWNILFHTFIGGFIIYRLLRMYDMLDSYKKPSDVQYIDNKKYYLKNNHSPLRFFGKNKNEHITLEKDTFICIKSEGHYIKIFYLCPKNHQVKYMFLRNTMKEITNQTNDYSYIYRCHKSFFINLNLLNSVIGNSNKTHIYLEHFSDAIPVSKNKISYIKDKRLRRVI